MPIISGKDGKVTAGGQTVADVTGWTFRVAAHNVAYASSATGGYKRRLPGSKDGAGRFGFKLDTSDPITGDLNEGSSVTLLLYVDASRYYSVPAVIDSMVLDVNVSTGEPIGGEAQFSTDGAWTEPSYA